MDDVLVFLRLVIQTVIIGDPARKAVKANGNNSFLVVNDDGADLGGRIK